MVARENGFKSNGTFVFGEVAHSDAAISLKWSHRPLNHIVKARQDGRGNWGAAALLGSDHHFGRRLTVLECTPEGLVDPLSTALSCVSAQHYARARVVFGLMINCKSCRHSGYNRVMGRS